MGRVSPVGSLLTLGAKEYEIMADNTGRMDNVRSWTCHPGGDQSSPACGLFRVGATSPNIRYNISRHRRSYPIHSTSADSGRHIRIAQQAEMETLSRSYCHRNSTLYRVLGLYVRDLYGTYGRRRPPIRNMRYSPNKGFQGTLHKVSGPLNPDVR